MTKYPSDRFDGSDASATRAGAHRSAVVRRPWWIKVLTVFGATAVLIVAALAGVTVIDAKLNFELPDFAIGATPTPTPTPTVTFLDPTTLTERQLAAVTITILNGTTSPTLPEDVNGMLMSQGWPQSTFTDAAENTVKQTVVVYRYPADELMALSIANALGVDTVEQSDVYRGARVYVVLGSDFVQ